jgi:uncharacterized protein (DUF983 family)
VNPAEKLRAVDRGAIALRGLTGRCPNCGTRGLHKSWFHLRTNCSGCNLDLEMEEGFYAGTTSFGYVLILLVVVLPVAFLVIYDVVGVVGAIAICAIGTVGLTVGLYPVMLSWVLMTYYLWFPDQLPANGGSRPK